MLKWLKKTALWIVAVPLLSFYLGAGLNQLVLVANHDRFPVMLNSAKIAEVALEEEKAVQACQAGETPAGDLMSLLTGQKPEQPAADAPPPDCSEQIFALQALDHGFLDERHVIMTNKTHLNLLADIFDLGGMYSVGDGLISAGEHGMDYAPLIWATVVICKLSKKEEE